MDNSTEVCEYYNCSNPATTVLVIHDIDCSVCDQHADDVTDDTGYCPISCQLGYGCDDSC